MEEKVGVSPSSGGCMRRILAAFAFGCAFLAAPAAMSGAEQAVIASHDLYKAVIADSGAVETLYLGKTILVKGIVISTGISRYMTPNVVLSDREGGEAQIICVLPRLDAGKLSDFKPGQIVTMSGRAHRLSERVVLKECKAVE